jgi:hypothetical protein
MPPIPAFSKQEITVAAQLEIGMIIHTGAAIESTIYENFAFETQFRFIIGFITVPTVKQLK